MTAPMTPRNRIQLHFGVATDDQAAELSAAWEEIVSGKRTRISTAAEDTNEIMERARVSLQTIAKAIEENPGTGQTGRLVRFLAGVYNGNECHFDLTDLRALDTELATPDGDRPLVHARLLSESVEKLLCGATDGPWSVRGFDFERVTGHECQALVLNP
jgi:hypothetical protein